MEASYDGDLSSVDAIESDTYWDIVRRNDKTAEPARWQTGPR